MARITVEDCLENIDNIALREIAEGHVTPAILEEIEQPPAEEFIPPDSGDDMLPMRGISIGD